jgi:hypothetical protein
VGIEYVFGKVGRKGVGLLCIVRLSGSLGGNLVNGEQVGEVVQGKGEW